MERGIKIFGLGDALRQRCDLKVAKQIRKSTHKRCNGTELNPSTNHRHFLLQEIARRFLKLGLPISSDFSCSWAISTSRRVGLVMTCIVSMTCYLFWTLYLVGYEQLLALSNSVLMILITRWTPILALDTSAQFAEYSIDCQLLVGWLDIDQMVKMMFRRHINIAIAALLSTPPLQPEKTAGRSNSFEEKARKVRHLLIVFAFRSCDLRSELELPCSLIPSLEKDINTRF